MLNALDRTLRRSQNAISDVHPIFRRLSKPLVRYYARAWIWGATVLGSVRYDAPIDPMRIYYVDPTRIERTVTWTHVSANVKADEHPRFRSPNYRLAGRVFDGDWDMIEARFTDSTIYRSFVDHFIAGVPWQETPFYEETLAAIEAGSPRWGCRSRHDLDQRCAYLDILHDRIGSDGYRTQDELHAAGDPATNPHRVYRVLWREIAVNVGRNGEFIFQDGRNRLAIARTLGLREVPVVILVRHALWQQTRDRIARGEVTAADLPPHLQTHPDLVDLL